MPHMTRAQIGDAGLVSKPHIVSERKPTNFEALPLQVLVSVLIHVTNSPRECDEQIPFYLLSKRTHNALTEHARLSIHHIDAYDGVRSEFTLFRGRIYAVWSTSAPDHPLRLPLPPVTRVWHGSGSWFAMTLRGLFAWGNGYSNKLGVTAAPTPTRVPIAVEVTDVVSFPQATFFRTDDGWLGAGFNFSGQLGFEDSDDDDPTPIPGSGSVVRWDSPGGPAGVSFAWMADCRLLACGNNDYGQCGVGCTKHRVPLAPMPLPGATIQRVVCGKDSTFLLAGRRCYACGRNMSGELGLGSTEPLVTSPVEMGMSVDQVITADRVTLIISDGVLYGCGTNGDHMLTDDDCDNHPTPTRVHLPDGATTVAIRGRNVCARQPSGMWVARGFYSHLVFANINGRPPPMMHRKMVVQGWAAVNEQVSRQLTEITARRESANAPVMRQLSPRR